jgi:hypothetical protein
VFHVSIKTGTPQMLAFACFALNLAKNHGVHGRKTGFLNPSPAPKQEKSTLCRLFFLPGIRPKNSLICPPLA